MPDLNVVEILVDYIVVDIPLQLGCGMLLAHAPMKCIDEVKLMMQRSANLVNDQI